MALEKKRVLFVSAYVVVFMLFFAAIFYYGWQEKQKTLQERDLILKDRGANQRVLSEQEHKTADAADGTQGEKKEVKEEGLAAASLEDIKIGTDTTYRLEIYDIHTQELTIQEGEMPPGFLGMTREDLGQYWEDYMKNLSITEFQKGLLSCDLTSFSTECVTVRKTYEGSGMKYRYYMILQQGTLSIYYSDKKTPYEHTDITEEQLPAEQLEQLKTGVYVEDEETLYGILESYTS